MRDVLVSLARPERLADPARRAAALALCTDEERTRLARFHFDRDRDVALASRALERRALGRAAGVDPAAWRFVADAHGRPGIAAPRAPAGLAWNVANTHGLVVCAIVRDGAAIGIDVEPRRADAPPEIVASHFAPAERDALHALPAAARPERFVALWTLKEAYVKARGLGLGLPLDRFAIDPVAVPPGLAIDPAMGDDAARWQLALWWPLPTHAVALCVARAPGGAARAIVERWDDLA